jgi:subtilisin family serine protease
LYWFLGEYLMALRKKTLAILMIFIIIIILSPGNTSTFNSPIPNLESKSISSRPDNYPVIASWDNWIRDKNQNRLDDNLDILIAQGVEEQVNIYINYNVWPMDSDLDYLEVLGVNISYRAKYIPTICAREVSLEILELILKSSKVAMIEQQPYLAPLLDVSARSILARESEYYSPESAWELGFTGQGITIAILDTGVDDRHESLDNKYIIGYDCTLRVPRETNPDDEDGHGTHCAGIALGTGGEDGQYIGIARNAKLIDVKVLNDIGLTPGDQIIHGIEYCINNKETYSIDVLSISIGEFFTGNDDGSGTHARLVNTAADEGLVMVVAAGNDGPNNNGFSSLAAADGAITVGSIDEIETVKRSDDSVSDFSNRGPRADDGDGEDIDELKPDVVAPGESIMSALYSETQIGLITGYQQLSGTSMACPHVAGLAALLLEAEPTLSPNLVKQIIRDSAEPRGYSSYLDIDPNYNIGYGWGIVNSYEAVRMVLGEDYQFIDVLSHDTWETVHNIVTIYGSASLESGNIQEVEYQINDGTWQKAEGQEDWSFDWDTRSEENGPVRITLRSFDGIDHSREYVLDLVVNNIGSTILVPINGSTVKGSIIIKGSSFGNNVESVSIKIGDEPWVNVLPTSGQGNYSTWQYEWNSNKVSDGEYTIAVKAYNKKWYSIPDEIIYIVNNKKPPSKGFLPGFELATIIIALLSILIIGYGKRNEP